jgi:hypothetical protein
LGIALPLHRSSRSSGVLTVIEHVTQYLLLAKAITVAVLSSDSVLPAWSGGLYQSGLLYMYLAIGVALVVLWLQVYSIRQCTKTGAEQVKP